MSAKRIEESAIDRVRDLPIYQKVLLIITLVLGVYLIGVLLFSSSSEQDPEVLPEETSNSIEAPQESPSPVPHDFDMNELNDDANRLPFINGTPIPEVPTESKIPVSDARKALEVASSGAKEFTTWGEKETLDSRMKRINKYFVKDSVSKNFAPSGSEPASSEYLPEKKHPKYTYFSKVETTAVTGGDTKRFRVLVSLKVRWADLDQETGKINSTIKENYPTYTVDLTKKDGEWKILDLVNDGQ